MRDLKLVTELFGLVPEGYGSLRNVLAAFLSSSANRRLPGTLPRSRRAAFSIETSLPHVRKVAGRRVAGAGERVTNIVLACGGYATGYPFRSFRAEAR